MDHLDASHARHPCHDPGDPRGRHPTPWRPGAHEHRPVQRDGPDPQPVRQCLTHVDGDRQGVLTALAGHPHAGVRPVDVVQAQRGDLPGTQPQSNQDRDQRPVPGTDHRPRITGGQQRRHLRGAHPARHASPAAGRPEDPRTQVPVQPAGGQRPLQQAPHRGHDTRARHRRVTAAALHHVAVDGRGIQATPLHRPVRCRDLVQHPGGVSAAGSDGLHGQPPLLTHPRAPLPDIRLRRRDRRGAGRAQVQVAGTGQEPAHRGHRAVHRAADTLSRSLLGREPAQQILADVTDSGAALFHPPAQSRQQIDDHHAGLRRISLPDRPRLALSHHRGNQGTPGQLRNPIRIRPGR